MGIGHGAADVLDVLGQCAPQLFAAVLLAALGQQIDDTPASPDHPVHAQAVIDEAQHFHLVQAAFLRRPGIDVHHRLPLAIGHAGRGHLDAIHFQRLQQRPRNIELFLGSEGDALRLLPITQGGVQQPDVAYGSRLWRVRTHSAWLIRRSGLK